MQCRDNNTIYQTVKAENVVVSQSNGCEHSGAKAERIVDEKGKPCLKVACAGCKRNYTASIKKGIYGYCQYCKTFPTADAPMFIAHSASCFADALAKKQHGVEKKKSINTDADPKSKKRNKEQPFDNNPKATEETTLDFPFDAQDGGKKQLKDKNTDPKSKKKNKEEPIDDNPKATEETTLEPKSKEEGSGSTYKIGEDGKITYFKPAHYTYTQAGTN